MDRAECEESQEWGDPGTLQLLREGEGGDLDTNQVRPSLWVLISVLDSIPNARGRHWRVLNRGVACSSLQFCKNTQAAVWKVGRANMGSREVH